MFDALRPVTFDSSRPLVPCVLAYLFLSCGTAEQVRFVRDEPPPQPGIETKINACPSFTFSMVLPKQIRPGELATVLAFAVDPDSDDTQLRYAWSATSGDFVAPADSLTEYACVGSGAQVLRVTTSDPDGCDINVDFDVTCDVP
jgi:hypothetical protein